MPVPFSDHGVWYVFEHSSDTIAHRLWRTMASRTPRKVPSVRKKSRFFQLSGEASFLQIKESPNVLSELFLAELRPVVLDEGCTGPNFLYQALWVPPFS